MIGNLEWKIYRFPQLYLLFLPADIPEVDKIMCLFQENLNISPHRFGSKIRAKKPWGFQAIRT